VAPTGLDDFFPNTTPRQLAKKKDICSGARPAAAHSHFFTADGEFGSRDENGEQDDAGTYKLKSPTVVMICSEESPPYCGASDARGLFKFAIRNGNLSLTPLITAAQRREALAHPFAWSPAGWMVAVSYPGHEWMRTACSDC
jgi:hypothetical protein